MTDPARSTETQPPPAPSHFRGKLGAAIFLVCCAAETAAWIGLAPNRTWQAFATWVIVPLSNVLMLIWWTLLSGLPIATRALGLGLFALTIGIGAALFRVEGFTGEMFPILTFRWTETARERAERYWQTTADTPSKPEIAIQPVEPDAQPEAQWDNWPEFRGPQRDGVAQTRLSNDWTTPPPLLWRHPVGAGWSSFSVFGPRLYTQEQRGDDEAVVCYELETGQELWSHRDQAHFSLNPAGEGPRATPTVFQKHVYSLGATGILNCLAFDTGQRVWSRQILEENGAKNLEWGLAASPLVFGELVVVNPGGPNGKGVVAYHRLTGERVWSAGSDRASYASLQLSTLCGEEVILLFDGVGLGAHDPRTGSELWQKFSWTNSPAINVAQPVLLENNRVLISSGYGTGSALLEVSREAQDWRITPVWTSRDMKLKFNDAVVHQGFAYGLDEGILVCLDLKTGRRRWKQGRYGFGQLLLADETLLIQSESGEVVLLNATPQGHHELGRFPALDGHAWNCPVLCRNRLLLRNNQEAACYDVSRK